MSSRTMHLPGDAVGVLTPFADMHNYCPPPAPVPPALPGDPAYHVPGLSSPADAIATGVACRDMVASEIASSSESAPAEAVYDGATERYTFTAVRDHREGEQATMLS